MRSADRPRLPLWRRALQTLVAFAAVTSAVRRAGAEPVKGRGDQAPSARPGWVAAGVELAADQNFIDAAVAVEGGYRIGDTAFSLHALAAGGAFGGGWQVSASGPYAELRAGVEGEHCFHTGWQLCGVLGIDAGYQRRTSNNEIPADGDALLVYGRAGLALHVARVRVALMLDLRNGLHLGDTASGGLSGGGGVATIGFSF